MGEPENEIFRIDWLDDEAIAVESEKLKKLSVHMSKIKDVELFDD